jgi:hypothetical protein
MISIDELTTDDVGRWVVYRDRVGNTERGRIKYWNRQFVFVVFNCANEWRRYKDFTAAAVTPKDLEFTL